MKKLKPSHYWREILWKYIEFKLEVMETYIVLKKPKNYNYYGSLASNYDGYDNSHSICSAENIKRKIAVHPIAVPSLNILNAFLQRSPLPCIQNSDCSKTKELVQKSTSSISLTTFRNPRNWTKSAQAAAEGYRVKLQTKIRQCSVIKTAQLIMLWRCLRK